jgi:hypothetical protein
VKALASRSFDAAFVYRRKSAFNLPLAQYFRSRTFVTLMEDRLLPGMASRGLVDVSVVRRWWRRALSAPSTSEGFWIPVALELWAQQFIDGRGLDRARAAGEPARLPASKSSLMSSHCSRPTTGGRTLS